MLHDDSLALALIERDALTALYRGRSTDVRGVDSGERKNHAVIDMDAARNGQSSEGRFIAGPADVARAKQDSREQDAADLASGRKSREQLRAENGAFGGSRLRVNFSSSRLR